jgi:hypothetical protein
VPERRIIQEQTSDSPSRDQAMSESYQFHLYKMIDAAARPPLEPFFRMLWEHGISFAESLVAEPLEWDQAWQNPSSLYADGELQKVPLGDAVARLVDGDGCLTLFDKQMGYACWINWIASPAGHPVLSLRLDPSPWALQVRAHLAWHNSKDPETYLLANYQQGMVSFLHWSALCCQWFVPELAGSYEWQDSRGYRFPEDLLHHLDEKTFPARAQWGWMMYLPASVITAGLLLDLVRSPELTLHSLMPAGLQVCQLPSLFHYETRAGYELEKEPTRRLSGPSTADDKAAAEEEMRNQARMYQRAIVLFQAAHHAEGEGLARIGLEQTAHSIEQIRRNPTVEEIRRQVREDLLRRQEERRNET